MVQLPLLTTDLNFKSLHPFVLAFAISLSTIKNQNWNHKYGNGNKINLVLFPKAWILKYVVVVFDPPNFQPSEGHKVTHRYNPFPQHHTLRCVQLSPSILQSVFISPGHTHTHTQNPPTPQFKVLCLCFSARARHIIWKRARWQVKLPECINYRPNACGQMSLSGKLHDYTLWGFWTWEHPPTHIPAR